MKKTFSVLSFICFVFAFFFSFCLIGYSFLGLLTASLGAYFLFMALTPKKIKKTRFIVSILAIIGVASTISLCGVILSEVRGDIDPPCDYLIVLGAGIHGETPSRTLTDRLDRAVEYLKRVPTCTVIVSGGQGDDEDITEALAMERYLVSHGIDKERIIREEKSENTHENMLFSKNIIDSHDASGNGSVAIISSDYHLYRARRLADNAGMSPYMLSAKTSLPVLFVNCLFREAFALVKAYIVFM